jgi:hypothetical protein
MKTTLNKIRGHHPSVHIWKKLLAHLGKTKADDEPLSIATILEANGLDDAIYCLRAVEGRDKEIRLYAVWCARQMQHLMKDPRSLAALDVAEAYANGAATDDELEAAEAEARAAAGAAAGAAGAAGAEAASWDAARAASRCAARAAWDAAESAEAAACAAAEAAARAASRVSARDAQKQELLRICAEIEASEKGQP